MSPAVTPSALTRLFLKWSMSILLYLIAMLAALVEVKVALAIYIGVPLMFFIPALQEGVIDDLGEGDEVLV